MLHGVMRSLRQLARMLLRHCLACRRLKGYQSAARHMRLILYDIHKIL